MSLDHGLLSIPNRTNGINAELDKYKREQAKALRKARRAEACERQAKREEALALLAEFQDRLIEKYGDRYGRGRLKSELRRMALWDTTKFLLMIEKFKSESKSA